MQEESMQDFDIAITGLACRFPGASSVQAFWHNLCDGKETLSFFSEEELLAAGIEGSKLKEPGYVGARGTLAAVDSFDASFFGYSPREAEIMDPQQRIFLECAWEAFENANCDIQTYAGRVGVFAGSAMSSYLLANLYPVYGSEVQTSRALMLGNDKDYLPARISYKLNLKGPSLSVNTTCSTALVAIHLACQSLLHRECDTALAGGIAIALPQLQGYLAEEESNLSPDGHCRSFSAEARGFVPSNGVGVVILKRLTEALADQDHIYAVIKGSAINNDGASKMGFTTPSVEGQASVVTEALAMAGCSAESISYVETHGTGTDLGDSIEVTALTRAFRIDTQRQNFCAIGSVKPNIGHSGAASGMASFIKAVLALHHQYLPPSLNCETLNPNIDFAHSPFYVKTQASTWPAGTGPRRAGVHSFGVGGTNAHLILEEAPVTISSTEEGTLPAYLLVLSAKTESALQTISYSLAQTLRDNPALSLASVAYTLQAGRAALKYRRAIVCRDRAEAVQQLESGEAGRIALASAETAGQPVIFLCPNTQPGMGLDYQLYQNEPVYRDCIDKCAQIVRSTLGTDLRDILFGDAGKNPQLGSLLKKPSVAFPLLFMSEYALAQLWISWGVKPQAILGQGSGEYVAACLAGTIQLEDVFHLVLLRAQLFEEMAEIIGLSSTSRSSAAQSTAITSLLEQCKTYLDRIPFATPRIPFVSEVTGTWITPEQATDPEYWVQHLRQPEAQHDLSRLLTGRESALLLVLGSGDAQQTLRDFKLGGEHRALSSLSPLSNSGSEYPALLQAAGSLWQAGVVLEWRNLYHASLPRLVALPTYPFERQRYWIGPEERTSKPVEQAQASVDNAVTSATPAVQRYPRPDLETPYVEPRTDIERYIAGIYEELLGIESIGVDDDFFEFGGGDSLVGTRVIARLKQTYQVNISMRDIFEMPTVADLAQAIAKEISHA